jgi:hypothetical protein
LSKRLISDFDNSFFNGANDNSGLFESIFVFETASAFEGIPLLQLWLPNTASTLLDDLSNASPNC